MSTPVSDPSVTPAPTPVVVGIHEASATRRAVKPRWKRGRFVLLTCVLAAVLFVGLVSYMRELERDALRTPDYAASLSPGASVIQTARVAESVRALKLVTVQITTRVSSESADSSWRGSASATVEAPVRMSFGTDLSHLDEGAISFSALMNSVVVRVPPPSRIATEVMGNQEENKVHVGWLRFRAQAGEKHLSTARRDLYEQALELRLLPEDAQKVREDTRDQVAKLMHSIVGKEVAVRILFSDEPGGRPVLPHANVPSDSEADPEGPTIHVPQQPEHSKQSSRGEPRVGGSR